MKDKFSLQPANLDAAWDAFVQNSPEGTVFSESGYLTAIQRKPEAWYVLKGDQPKAGLILLRSRDGSGYELDDDVIYSGLFFAAIDPAWEQNQGQTLSNRFQLTEFVVEELTRRTPRIGLALAPGIEDIRPFLWHAYHDTDPSKRFTHNLRYTSYLDISTLLEGEEEKTSTFQSLGTSRKQEIRYARRDQAQAVQSDQIDEFCALLNRAASDQGRDVSARSKQLRDIMSNLKTQGRGHLFCVQDAQGNICSGAFFAHDSKRAYYLYGANDPERQNRYSGTLVLWDAFRHMGRLGLKEIDLEGVNSPKRGWFKMSFGGRLRSYHQLILGGHP